MDRGIQSIHKGNFLEENSILLIVCPYRWEGINRKAVFLPQGCSLQEIIYHRARIDQTISKWQTDPPPLTLIGPISHWKNLSEDISKSSFSIPLPLSTHINILSFFPWLVFLFLIHANSAKGWWLFLQRSRYVDWKINTFSFSTR